MLKHHNLSPVNPRRVVILGANGFIARDLAQFLPTQGMPVEVIGSAQVDLLQPDAAEKLRARLRAEDALIVTSALTPEKGRDEATAAKNLAMIKHVCAAIKASSCAQVIEMSSDGVFGDQEKPFTEGTPLTGISPYGKMHAEREVLLAEAAKARTPLCIIRPCAVYGAKDTHNAYGPNRFLRSALKERQIILFGEGEEERDHLYIRDLSKLIALCLARRTEGVLNAATGQAVTFRDLAQQIVKHCPEPVEIIRQPRATVVNSRRHFDVGLLRREFPDFRCRGLAEGLAEMRGELAGTS